MALRFPDSMEECIYFTRRIIGSGKAAAWVFRQPCTACKKGMMGKPVDEKTGKAKIRALEYTCSSCHASIEKKEYEETLSCNIQYTCPSCGKSGEAVAPFKRKSFEGVPAIVFQCASCSKKLGITKKMKEGKKKAAVDAEDDDF
ncbi:hypothetical protein HYU19_02485 [Candidatus Woesearchaeota archaeon]|nr:hypothetical protein [Candidatus Woesearchaeota archaeon]